MGPVAVDEAEEGEAGGGQEAGHHHRRLALGEEGFEYVEREAEGLDGAGAGPHYHALDPQPDEGCQRAETRG